MLKVALTGGIASGKSAASARFEALGVPVIDADIIARELVEPGQPALAEIAQHFGSEVLLPDGSLNRPHLRELIFAKPEQREALQAILHPRIHARISSLAENAQGPYVLMVIPLLAESQRRYPQDRVLVIDCPEDQQRQRLMARDGSSAEQVDQILASQVSRAQRLAIADDVICNDGELAQLHAAIDAQHAAYLKHA